MSVIWPVGHETHDRSSCDLYFADHVLHDQLGTGHVIHDQSNTGHVFHDQLIAGHVLHDQ